MALRGIGSTDMFQIRALDFTPSCQLLKCQSRAIRCGDSSVKVARTAPPNISNRPPTRGSTCSGSRSQCRIPPNTLACPHAAPSAASGPPHVSDYMCLKCALTSGSTCGGPKCLARQVVKHWHTSSNPSPAQQHNLRHEATCRSHSTADSRITLSQYNTRNLPAQ